MNMNVSEVCGMRNDAVSYLDSAVSDCRTLMNWKALGASNHALIQVKFVYSRK
jgi:hypothetical protein